jgi:hypothetical protein
VIFTQAAVPGSEAVGPNRRLWREQASRQKLTTVVRVLSPRVVWAERQERLASCPLILSPLRDRLFAAWLGP